MDEAGSRARIKTMTRPPEIKELEQKIEEIKEKKEEAIKEQDFTRRRHARRGKAGQGKPRDFHGGMETASADNRVVISMRTSCR